MYKRLFSAFLSMLRSARRMEERSWATELFSRYLKNLFMDANSRSLEWLRAQLDKGSPPHPAVSKIRFSQRKMDGVDCMIAAPKVGASVNCVIVYYHGGGYVCGSPKAYRALIAELAFNSNCLVVVPAYRLAPEHPFPAPQDDCLAVAHAVFEAYPNHKVLLCGDSAGGGLAISTSLEIAKTKSEKSIDGLVLISPWVEPTAVGGTMKSNEANDFLMTSFLGASYAALMRNEDYTNPRVNFLNTDLSGLPKTLIQFGGGELFADQIQAFAKRAQAADVDLLLQNYPGQFHDFQVLSMILSDAKKAMSEITKFIERTIEST